MNKPAQIVIAYFYANGMDWAKAYHTPYNRNYVGAVKLIPIAHYDMEDKAWCCLAEFGNELTSTVKRFFPDIPIDIQEHRNIAIQHIPEIQELYAKGETHLTFSDYPKEHRENVLNIGGKIIGKTYKEKDTNE